MTGTSLEEIFENSQPEEVDPPKQGAEGAKPEAEPVVEAAPEPETGEDLSTEPVKEAAPVEPDPGAPPAPSEEIPSGHVPRAALEDERRKRQEAQTASKELEDRLADLEKRLTAPQPQPVQQPQPQPQQPPTPQVVPKAPDPWTDPEGALAYAGQQADQKLLDMRVTLSQDMMRSTTPDYDEVEAVFIAEAKRDPLLTAQMVQASNPAKFAYEKGRQLKLMSEIGSDPSAYEQQIRDKIMAEIEEARAAEAAQASQATPPQSPATPPAPPPPTSLAGVPSSAPRQSNERPYDGPTPLDELLN